MMKKIIITWDLDGFIGALNATIPYNYHFEYHEKELESVRKSLRLLRENNIKTTYAITGFSAEEGQYPYTFPTLISEITQHGHEVASHSWRHEWIPLHTKTQIQKSLKRSKIALEKIVGRENSVLGFVPPHNRPATWIRKGAYSFGDRGLFPLFHLGDLSNLITLLKTESYKWIRIIRNPILSKFRRKKRIRQQKVYNHRGILVLENHYAGFDQNIIDYIEQTNQEYFTVSAHPVMLSYTDDRAASWSNLERFIRHFSNRDDIEFVTPSEILPRFGIE